MSCHECLFEKHEKTLEAFFMGALVPVIVLNLVLYALFSRKLRNRKVDATKRRDKILSKTVLLLSAFWMILWFPIIIFRIAYGFMETPNLGKLFAYFSPGDYIPLKRYYLTEFVLVQISILFSSVNSLVLIVLLSPFHEPLLKLRRFIFISQWLSPIILPNVILWCQKTVNENKIIIFFYFWKHKYCILFEQASSYLLVYATFR